MRRIVGSILCAGALAACASPFGGPSEGGLQTSLEQLEQSPFSCVRGDDVQAYVTSLWETLQEAWELPAGVPSDQVVSVRLSFHANGEPEGPPEIVAATNEALRRSVEAAVAAAVLPEPPPEARPCLAWRTFRVDFANPASPERAIP